MERWNGTSEDKVRFHREGAKVLRQVAKYLGLAPGKFEVRSNKGGIAVGGEVMLHSDNLYLSVSGYMGGSSGYIFGRKCHGRKDYGSGMDCPNHDFEWELLADPKSLADVILLEGLKP